jgi:enoyl-CoA hydratase/carnithine racemase
MGDEVLMSYSSFETVQLTRTGEVLEVRLQSVEGGSLIWNATAHREIGDAFAQVASDPTVKVVVVTGTGDAFCDGIDGKSFAGRASWDPIWWEGKRLLKCLLDIDVPVLSAINGPATIHAELGLIADIVIAADTTVLADRAHFSTGSLPADGVHLVWRYLLGPQRAKYFLMTNQVIDAVQALSLGVVNEVVPAADVHARVHELAQGLATKPLPFLRYAREALNMIEREQLLAGLSHGLALEGVTFADVAALRATTEADIA